jgi:hypothetical protein
MKTLPASANGCTVSVASVVPVVTGEHDVENHDAEALGLQPQR